MFLEKILLKLLRIYSSIYYFWMHNINVIITGGQTYYAKSNGLAFLDCIA